VRNEHDDEPKITGVSLRYALLALSQKTSMNQWSWTVIGTDKKNQGNREATTPNPVLELT